MNFPGDMSIEEVLQHIFPEKSNKWKKWQDILDNEDLETVKDIEDLDVKEFDNLKISAVLRSGLRKIRESQPIAIQTIASDIPERSVQTAKQGNHLL